MFGQVCVLHHNLFLAHGLKSASFWPTETSNWWVNRRTAMTWHSMTYFYLRISRKFCLVNDFRQTQIFVKLVISSHKWWSYVKPFWVQLCLEISNFPIKMSNCTRQQQKCGRTETYPPVLVINKTNLPKKFFCVFLKKYTNLKKSKPKIKIIFVAENLKILAGLCCQTCRLFKCFCFLHEVAVIFAHKLLSA